jgi:hypothetical protein
MRVMGFLQQGQSGGGSGAGATNAGARQSSRAAMRSNFALAAALSQPK